MGPRLPEYWDVKSCGPASHNQCKAGEQQREEKGWGSTPRVSQLWRVANKPSLLTCKETGLLDRVGGAELLSGLQKGTLR